MTEKEIYYFKTVADEKSISGAAKKLYVAQPSLSQYIKRIETNLKTPLFSRTATGLTLTFAGERYYRMASQILKIYGDFETEISDINEMRTGRIHIGITSHLGTLLLPKLLSRFSALCPCVEIQITEETSDILEQLLSCGKLDMVIMHAPKIIENPGIEYDFLSRDPFLIVTSKSLALSHLTDCISPDGLPLLDIRGLKDERLITLPASQRIRQVTDLILRKADIVNPNIYLTVKNFATAQLLAASGLGYTMIPAQYTTIPTMHEEVMLYSVPEEYEAYWDLCIATLKDVFLSKADMLLMKLLKEHLF